MGPTRKRDLAGAVAAVAIVGYVLVGALYRWFPPLTIWTGLSLLAVAIGEAGWAFYVRAKINDGQIGVGAGRLDPLTVAGRSSSPRPRPGLAPSWPAGGSECSCTCCPARRPEGGRRGHSRCGRGCDQCPGADRRGGVATALLQVSRGAAGQRRYRDRVNELGQVVGRIAAAVTRLDDP